MAPPTADDTLATAPAPSGPAAAPPPPPSPKRRSPLRWLGWTLAVLALIVAAIAGGVVWLWHSEAGIARVLQRVPGLTVTGMQGRPTGGRFAIERLEWEGAGLEVVVEQLAWDQAEWRFRPHRNAWIGLTLDAPRAARVAVERTEPPPPDEPSQPPESLQFPVEFVARGLKVGSVDVDGQTVVRDIAADLHVGAAGGTEHRIANLSLARDDLTVGGRATVGATGELPVDAALTVASRPADPALAWQADVTAQGPLQRLGVRGDLRLAGGAGAQLSATVAPFAPWPLLALSASAEQLDLSALAPALPKTALTGTATLAEPGAAAAGAAPELTVSLSLKNGVPGAWDASRLPLSELDAVLRGRPDDPTALAVEQLRAQLAGSQPAGVVSGSGGLADGRLTLSLTLDGLRPERLDSRAPPMTLDGRIGAVVAGLPVPGAAAAPAAPAAPTAPTATTATTATTAASGPAATPPATPAPAAAAASAAGLSGEVDVDLRGRLPRRGAPPLALDALLRFAMPDDGSLRLDVERLKAVAGDGSAGAATATATVERSAAGALQIRSQGELARFDPAPWWPAAAAAAGRGRDRLDGRWQADLALPASATATPAAAPSAPSSASAADGTNRRTARRTAPQPAADPLAMLRALRGSASFTLDDSRLAGLDWRGSVALDATAQALRLDTDLRAGPNRIQAQGRLPSAPRAVPQGQIELRAPQLAALAPLARLLPDGAAAAWPRQGSLTVDATAQGAWPDLRSRGTLKLNDLRTPQVSVGSADAEWNLSTAGVDAPLSLRAQVADLRTGPDGPRLDRLAATLEGSLGRHALTVEAASPLRPPAWADGMLAGTPAAAAVAGAPPGSALRIAADGAWSPAAAGGGTWRGRIERLRAAPRGGDASPWLVADDLRATVTVGAAGGLQSARLEPGRVSAFGGGLAWQQAEYRASATPGGAPSGVLKATVDPIRVAPILMQLQPQFGWRGDLVIGGRIDVSAGARFDADVVVERSGGDLSLTVEGATRSLGLSDLRLALAAHDGRWVVTQALVGRTVGVIGGLQQMTTSPQAMVPPPSTPLTGGMSLQVPDLAVYAPWLPPGWRLGGNLRVGAAFTGTVGSPQYRGEVTGEQIEVRNLFEGVHLQQGQVAITLTGTEATIQRFVFRDGAGPGTLSLGGTATFAGQPDVSMRVSARTFRLLDRYDRRVTVSGDATLDLRNGRLAVGGGLKIDDGLIDITQADAPKLDSDVVVVNRAPLGDRAVPAKAAVATAPPRAPQAGSAPPTATPPPAPFEQVALDLRVDLGQSLRLRGRGIDALLRGQLRVTTPGGKLAVDGTIRIEEGTYTAYGQNLYIERGILRFDGDVSRPTLDILALRADIDTRVGVVVSGTAANPRVRLYSDPDLGEMDTLTWLILGRAPEGLGRDETALLQRAALALLAGDKGGGGGLLQQIGLDELSLSRSGAGDTADTIVSLGKQVSKRLFIGYEHALGAAGGSIQLIYRIVGQLTLRARTGSENAIDLIWTWRWD